MLEMNLEKCFSCFRLRMVNVDYVSKTVILRDRDV